MLKEMHDDRMKLLGRFVDITEKTHYINFQTWNLLYVIFSGAHVATIESLPQEIWLEILQNVSQKEWLDNVRFVSNIFANIVRNNLVEAEVPKLSPLVIDFLCSCPKLVRLSTVLNSGSVRLSMLGSFDKLRVLKIVGPFF